MPSGPTEHHRPSLAEAAVAAWIAGLSVRDTAVVAAGSSTLVTAVPPAAVRPGDLLVRGADDIFWSYRLTARPS